MQASSLFKDTRINGVTMGVIEFAGGEKDFFVNAPIENSSRT
jgi:hypothetical protein